MIEQKYINIKEYQEPLNKPQILCLGFFDAMHVGHQKIINKAKMLKFLNNAEISLFTFSNNPLKNFSSQKLIYTFEERISILDELEIDNVIYANFDSTFQALDKYEFLDRLLNNKNVIAVVCGEDYTFGKNKEGNVLNLKKYLTAKSIPLYVESLFMVDDKKVSSHLIREKLIEGNIDYVNSFLTMPYFVEGIVEEGKGIGHKDLYPTANIKIVEDKEIIAPGVYYTSVLIDGVHFRAVTNVGNKPTLHDNSYNIETYILYYTKNIYNKKIRVEFIEKIREIKKFDSLNELKDQITKDVKYVMNQNGGIDD